MEKCMLFYNKYKASRFSHYDEEFADFFREIFGCFNILDSLITN